MPDLPDVFLEIDLAPSDRAAGLIFDDATLGKFDTGEFAGGRGWVDVTADLISASCDRGISASERLYATAEAGTLQADLLNDAAAYDPTNDGSPYWNTLGGHTELVPMRRVRVRVEAPGVNIPPAPYLIWSGFLDSVELSYQAAGKHSIATLHATDALKVLANIDVALSTAGSLHSGSEIARILDAAGWTARSIDVGTLTIAAADLDNNAWAAAQLVAETELGPLFVDGFGNVIFQGRGALSDNLNSKWRQAVFADPDEIALLPGELPYADVTVEYSDENIANDVTITRADGLPQHSIDTASIAAYLRRTFSRDDLLLETDADAATYAALALDRLSTPELAITSLTFDLAADSRLVKQAFVRGISDRIEVHVAAPGRETPISRTVFIRSVSHDWDASRWVTTWALSDASYLGDGVQVAERSIAFSIEAALALSAAEAIHNTALALSVVTALTIENAREATIALSAATSFTVSAVQTKTITASKFGKINSNASTYTAARAGTGTKNVSTNNIDVGVDYVSSLPLYEVYQPFLEFDCSSIPAGATIVSAKLNMYVKTRTGEATDSVKVFAYDFGASIDTSDFRTSAPGTALLTKANTAWTLDAMNEVGDIASAFASTIRLVLISQWQLTPITPTSSTPSGPRFDDLGDANPPQLIVSYHA